MRKQPYPFIILLLCCLPVFSVVAAPKKPRAAVSTPTPSITPIPIPTEVVIDSVVASVDDKPITLSDLGNRLTPPRKLTLPEAAKDQAVVIALDALIMEKLVEAEATARRMSASDAEVENYIEEVAKRNTLSREDFDVALKNQGQSLESYKQQIKADILKTKLASTLSRDGTSISESEVDEYLANNAELNQSTPSIKLRQILIASQARTSEEVQSRVKEVLLSLDNGEEFGEVAKRWSDGPHSSDGGLIGTIAEKDLSADVLAAVSSLKSGHFSTPVEGTSGTQIFFVEERFSVSGETEESDGPNDEARRAEARRILQQQKNQARLSSYFVGELYKKHSVDKKL